MAGINDIAKAAGLKDSDVQMVFAQILELVKQDETNPDGSIKPVRVQIKGFGSFTRSTLKERTIFSPVLQGGQALVAARDVLRFKPSPHTKQYLNGEVEAPAIGDGAEESAAEAGEGEPEAEVEEAIETKLPMKRGPAVAKPAVAAPAAKPTAPAAKPTNGVKPVAPATKPVVAKPAPKPAPPPPPAEEEPADDENQGEFTGDD